MHALWINYGICWLELYRERTNIKKLKSKRRCGKYPAMDVLSILNDPLPRAERKIEQICQNLGMDCTDLNHEACWRGDRGTMPCCGLEVEFDRVSGICPFLWLKDHA
jgi:hypothetical protein